MTGSIMDFLPRKIAEYAEKHTTAPSALLQRIERETHLYVNKPRMLSGHLQGRTLAFLSQMLRPKRILEIGTYTGYSAICLAEGLADDGLLYTIDINEELEERVRGYLAEAGLADRVRYLIGNALALIPELDQTWDLVFIDADKANYRRYYELVIDRVRPGGWIVIDNVLWSGKVAEPHHQDKDTQSLRVFNELINLDDKVENLLLPIRDGLLIARKK